MLITQEKPKNPDDPRVIRTRRLLVDALNELMGEKSFDAITVSEIATRATLNRVTFYAHFQDKYALLEYDMSSRIQAEMQAKLGANPRLNEDMLMNLLSFVCNFLEGTQRHCPPPRGQMQSLVEKQLKAHIYDALLLGLEKQAKFRAQGPSAEQTAMVAAWAVYGAAFQWSQQDERQAVAQFVRQVLPLITTNLSPYLESAAIKPSVQRVSAGRGPAALLGPLRLGMHFAS
ncbi:MAG: TetR family transcriptional regulator [Anaerolineales bacterium]|nr:MAG: TetR family transcriptional regulator [Anaerolineales bacterium]